MAIGDLYECTTHLRTAEGVMQFTFGYLMESGIVLATTTQAASLEFGLNRLDAYIAAVSSDIEIDKVEFAAVTNFADITGFTNFNNLEGLLAGPALPNSSAAVLSLTTTAPNSKHNGRMYLPGVVESDQTDGTLLAAVVTALNTFGTKLELDLILPGPESAEFTPVVISRFVGGAKRVPPVGFNLVSAIVRPNLKQQRKRGGRRFGLAS